MRSLAHRKTKNRKQEKRKWNPEVKQRIPVKQNTFITFDIGQYDGMKFYIE